MPESPPPPETLAWLRQTAAVDGAAYSQVLLHLLERVEALEQRPIPGFAELAAPTPEAAPVATDEELQALYGLPGTFTEKRRACYDLGRQHGAGATQPEREGPSDDAWWHELVSEIARVQHVAAGEGQGPRFDLAEAVARWCHPTPPAPEAGEVVA